MDKEIYFDHAAAVPPEPEALECFLAASRCHYANAEAINLAAYRARKALQDAGTRLSQALTGNRNYPVIWGSSATELFRLTASFPGFSTSCATALEHPALSTNLKKSTRFAAIAVNKYGSAQIPGNSSPVDLGCLYQVQSELGAIQKCSEIFPGMQADCRLTDGVQAAGKLPLDLSGDITVVSGVKFGSPGGAALLLKPDGKFTAPLLKHAVLFRREDYAQSRINIPMAMAMALAAEKAVGMMEENFARTVELNRLIRDGLREMGIMTTLPGDAELSPYILNVMLNKEESAVVVRALGEKGIFAASGSACSAESGKPSDALAALGIRGKRAYRTLRLSFWHTNTPEDGKFFLSELKNVLKNY